MFGKKDKKIKITLYTKAGNIINFEVDKISLKTDRAGNLSSYEWSGSTKNINIYIGDIEAIVWDE